MNKVRVPEGARGLFQRNNPSIHRFYEICVWTAKRLILCVSIERVRDYCSISPKIEHDSWKDSAPPSLLWSDERARTEQKRK